MAKGLARGGGDVCCREVWSDSAVFTRAQGSFAVPDMHPPTIEIDQHSDHTAACTPGKGDHDPRGAGCRAMLEQFALRIGKERYARYFEPAAHARHADEALQIVVRSSFDADLLNRRFGAELRTVAGESLGDVQVQWVVDPGAFAADEEPERVPETQTSGVGGLPPRRPAAPSAAPAGASGRGPRYRLDDFVVGESNRLAFTAAERFVDEPPPLHGLSQLFIHGGCGIGKTHLLNGIAARFREQNPTARVSCVTGEMFANEFISAVQSKRLEAFRKRYRSVDLLLVDDVQFLAGKVKTQTELLHTIEALDLGHGRLVLASDEHPKRIDKLCKRLVSRCVCGMVARLDNPERGLRGQLAHRLAGVRGVSLEENAAHVVADVCAGSVREIEGAVVRLEAVARLEQLRVPVTAVLARRVLGNADLMRPRRPISVSQVAKTVCAELNVELSEVLGRGRHRLVVLARSMVALLSRELTTMSYPEIARALNRKNHSTIVTACQRLRRQMEEGGQQDAGPLQGLVQLTDLFQRLRDLIVRTAATGSVVSVA